MRAEKIEQAANGIVNFIKSCKLNHNEEISAIHIADQILLTQAVRDSLLAEGFVQEVHIKPFDPDHVHGERKVHG